MNFSFSEINVKNINEQIIDGCIPFPNIKISVEPLIDKQNITLNIEFDFLIPPEFTPSPENNENYYDDKYSFSLGLQLILCSPGEIYNSIIHSCTECTLGKYSFHSSDKECHLCPLEADYCIKNITNLKPGYWRSPQTGLIYRCDFFAENCLFLFFLFLIKLIVS